MLNTSRIYDSQEKTDFEKRQEQPGEYRTRNLRPGTCYMTETSVRMGSEPVAVKQSFDRVQAESELFNLERGLSRECTGQYNQSTNAFNSDTTRTTADCKGIHAHYTRYENPACTLRGTGWNRQDFLCHDPQYMVDRPFSWNVQNRILVKENHKPCLPTPLQEQALPPQVPKDMPKESVYLSPVPTHPQYGTWS